MINAFPAQCPKCNCHLLEHAVVQHLFFLPLHLFESLFVQTR